MFDVDRLKTLAGGLMSGGSVAVLASRVGASGCLRLRKSVLKVNDLKQLTDNLCKMDENPDIRNMLVSGRSGILSAGLDLRELGKEFQNESNWNSELHDCWNRLSSIKKPVVSVVDGKVMGLGLEILLLISDLIVVTKRASFSLPEVRSAIIPGFGGTQLLPMFLPKSICSSMILTGDAITAERALELGMVNIIAEPDTVNDTALRICTRLAGLDPQALSKAKMLMKSAFQTNGFRERLSLEHQCFKDLVMAVEDR